MFRILTFGYNGNPTPINYKKFSTKEATEAELKELKIIYNIPMWISEVKGGK